MDKFTKTFKLFTQTLIFLGLVLLMAPLQSFGQLPKTFSVMVTGSALINKDFPVKVVTSDGKANVKITIVSADPSVTLSGLTNGIYCITQAGGACSIYFKSSAVGQYTLGISAAGYANLVTSPIDVKGNAIILNADPSKVLLNQDSTITATLTDQKKDVDIQIAGVQSSLVNSNSCKTNSAGSCSVIFKQSNAFSLGSITIVAKAAGYTDGSTVIDVVKTLSPATTPPPVNNCTSGQTLQGGTCVNINTSYKMLEPLGGIGPTVDTGSSSDFAKYLNTMIKIFIGICAVLAMIMIVVGGIEYMTTELVSHKDEGKKRILAALGGLLLALGSYMLLNTINPDLLQIDPQIQQVTLSVLGEEVETAPPSPSTFTTTIPANAKTNGCPQGIVNINTSAGNFAVCSSIATNLTNMINSAWAQGYKISGGVLRSNSQQVNLRIANCGGNTQYNVYQKPASSCRPPTAIPGTSRHENGLAMDMTCNGTSIQSQSNSCFLWLKANARAYGFYNLPTEPWHWSVDGK